MLWQRLTTKTIINKKVLLRERKRHTARHVVNTPFCCPNWVPSPVLTWLGGGGYPTWVPAPPGSRVPPLAGYPPGRVPLPAGYPLPGPGGGVPPCQGSPLAGYPLAGYPTPGPGRVPPQGTPWQGIPPDRVPPLAGYSPGPGRVPPPQLDLAGTPPPGCPMAFWEMLQSIMGYGYPPPPPRCE